MINIKKNIAIVDCGVGNLHSITRAFEKFDHNAFVTEESGDIDNADAVVLPGVGSFEAGMRGLKLRNLTETVKRVTAEGKPLLGICLGAQILLSEGHEFGVHEGLDLVKGKVVEFPELEKNEKVPHINWNSIHSPKGVEWTNTILNGVDTDSEVYFVHSYILKPENNADILTLTKYGGYEFCSAIKKGNIYGCQFHPEKSAKIGLKIINNFINSI